MLWPRYPLKEIRWKKFGNSQKKMGIDAAVTKDEGQNFGVKILEVLNVTSAELKDT